MSSKLFVILLLSSCLCKNVQAQTRFAGSNRSTQTSTANEAPPLNLIKVNVTSLPLKNIGVQYERVLSKRISAGIGFRIMPLSGVPLKGVVKNYADDNEDAQTIIDNAKISNYAFTPEIRFYLGKGYGKGFYIAPYYRYVHFSTNTVPVSYTAAIGPKKTVNLDGDLTANTGGVLLGAQWFLGRHFCLDWWIIGAHLGSGSGTFRGIPATAFTPSEQNAVRQTLEDIDIPLVDKTVAVTPNLVTVKFDGTFGGLRSGILVGFRF